MGHYYAFHMKQSGIPARHDYGKYQITAVAERDPRNDLFRAILSIRTVGLGDRYLSEIRYRVRLR